LFGVITGFALTSGLKGDYQNIFLTVAVLITLSDPRFLTHDISFWLSFGATAGLLFGFPVLWPYLGWMKFKVLKMLIGASFCAQMSVFPILITQFGSFPYAGLFTNLVTEPLVPMIMFLAFGGMIIGNLPLLGLEFLWQQSLELSLSSLITVAQVGADLPEIMIPIWVGKIWFVLFMGFIYWSLLSPRYRRAYWQKFEREMSEGL
jgi:ComEC/Rec2-related protein